MIDLGLQDAKRHNVISEKARAFEEKKRKHIADIASRFLHEFRDDPVAAIRPYTELERPVNFSTGKEYRGQNVFTLNWAKADQGYKWNSWLTFNQARSLGAAVRKGEKGTAIIGAITGEEGENQVDRELKERRGYPQGSRDKAFVGFNLFYVFNLEQVDGLNPVDVARPGSNPFLRDAMDLDGLIRHAPYEVVFGYSDVTIDPYRKVIQYPSRAAFGAGSSGEVSSRFYSGVITLVELARILEERADEDIGPSAPEELLAALIIAAYRLRESRLEMAKSSLPAWLVDRILTDNLNLGRTLRIVDANLEQELQ